MEQPSPSLSCSVQLLGDRLCTPAESRVAASVAEGSQQDIWGSRWDSEEEGGACVARGAGGVCEPSGLCPGLGGRGPPSGGGLGPEDTRLELGLEALVLLSGAGRAPVALGPGTMSLSLRPVGLGPSANTSPPSLERCVLGRVSCAEASLWDERNGFSCSRGLMSRVWPAGCPSGGLFACVLWD